MWQLYFDETVVTERIPILNALGCWATNSDAGRIEVMKQHWSNILSSDVRLQDKRNALTATFTNTESNVQDIVDILIEHYNSIRTE